MAITSTDGGLKPHRSSLASDDGGTFDGGRLPRALYLIVASLPGHPDARIVVDLRDPGVVADRLVLTLKACRSQISGSVTDAAGGPIVGAHIAEEDGRGVTIGVESDSSGSYALCTRDHEATFQASADGYGSITFERTVQGRIRHEIVLVPEGIIEGIVVDSTEQPVTAVIEARVRSTDPERPSRIEIGAGADGRFRIEGLGEGRWVLQAWNDQGRSTDHGELLVRAGQTISGVTLVLESCSPLRGTLQNETTPLPGAQVSVVSIAVAQVSRPVPTDSAGAFELPCILPGAVRFRVDGYEVISPRPAVHEPGEGIVAVKVAPMGRIHGRVLRAGAAVPGAVVAYSGGVRPASSVRSDAQGRYAVEGLVASTYQLLVTSESARSQPQNVTLAQREDRELDIALVSGATMTGTVVDQDERPVAGVQVLAIRDDSKDGGRGMGDASGHFEVAGLAGGGNYAIASATMDSSGVALPILDNGKVWLTADATAEITLRVTLQRDEIAGRVRDAAGAPVPDATVAAVAGTSGAALRFVPWLPGYRTTTAIDGTFRLENLPRATYALRATTSTGAEGVATGVLSPARDVKVVVAAGGTISGKLEGFATRPQVVAKRVDESTDTSTRGYVEGDSFRILGLAAGRYLVSAQSVSDSAAASLALKSGENATLALRSSGSGRLRGRVIEYGSDRGVSGEICSLVAREGDLLGQTLPAAFADVDADGRFFFKEAPAGDLAVSCMGNSATHSAGLRTFSLTPGGDLDLEVAIAKCSTSADIGLRFDLRRTTPVVWLVTPGGDADTAGIRAGDVIVALEGASIANLAPHGLLCAMTGHQPGDQVHVDLQRDGHRVSVVLTVR